MQGKKWVATTQGEEGIEATQGEEQTSITQGRVNTWCGTINSNARQEMNNNNAS